MLVRVRDAAEYKTIGIKTSKGNRPPHDVDTTHQDLLGRSLSPQIGANADHGSNNHREIRPLPSHRRHTQPTLTSLLSANPRPRKRSRGTDQDAEEQTHDSLLNYPNQMPHHSRKRNRIDLDIEEHPGHSPGPQQTHDSLPNRTNHVSRHPATTTRHSTTICSSQLYPGLASGHPSGHRSHQQYNLPSHTAHHYHNPRHLRSPVAGPSHQRPVTRLAGPSHVWDPERYEYGSGLDEY